MISESTFTLIFGIMGLILGVIAFIGKTIWMHSDEFNTPHKPEKKSQKNKKNNCKKKKLSKLDIENIHNYISSAKFNDIYFIQISIGGYENLIYSYQNDWIIDKDLYDTCGGDLYNYVPVYATESYDLTIRKKPGQITIFKIFYR